MNAYFLIKYSVLVFCNYYSTCRSLEHKIASNSLQLLKLLVFTLSCSGMILLTSKYFEELRVVLMICTSFLFNEVSLRTDRERVLKATVFSYIVLYMESYLFLLTLGIVGFVFPSLHKLSETLVAIVVALFQLFFTWLLFKTKRLSRGMSTFFDSYHGDYMLCFCTLMLFIISLLIPGQDGRYLTVVVTSAVMVSALIIFFWAKAHIKKNYIERVQKKKYDKLSKMVSSLQAENEAFSAIVHKDNKLIPAMEMSVKEFLSRAALTDDRDERIEMTREMISQLEALSAERHGIVATKDYQVTGSDGLRTGVVVIDSLVSFMKYRAEAGGIKFSFNVSCDIRKMLSAVRESDLSTLLADLSENALIAVKHSSAPDGRVSVELGCRDSHYFLDVLDSGVPFPRTVLKKLGKQRITTHGDDGGSGIGMMTTCELCRKYGASLRIEPATGGDYTKCVSVVFDGASRMPLSD